MKHYDERQGSLIRSILGPFAPPTRCGPDCKCACFFDAGECCHARKVECRSGGTWLSPPPRKDRNADPR